MSKRTFRAEIDATGMGKLWLDGEDISNKTRGFEIKSEIGQGTQVVIHLAHGAELDLGIEGASVETTKPEPED